MYIEYLTCENACKSDRVRESDRLREDVEKATVCKNAAKATVCE